MVSHLSKAQNCFRERQGLPRLHQRMKPALMKTGLFFLLQLLVANPVLTLVFRGRFYKYNMNRYANSYDKQYNPDNQSLNRENDGTGNRYPQQQDGSNLYFPRHASSVQVIAHVGAKKPVV